MLAIFRANARTLRRFRVKVSLATIGTAVVLVGSSPSAAQVQGTPSNGDSPAAPMPTEAGYALPPAYAPPPGYVQSPGYPPPPGYGTLPGYPPSSYAPATEVPPPGYHKHDGLYVRLMGGGAHLQASNSSLGATLSGFGLLASGALGYAVANNFILYGELLLTVIANPTIEQTQAGSRSENGIELDHYALGPGLAYYIQRWDAYFSGTLTYGRLTQTQGTVAGSGGRDLTNFGIGTSLTFGKEWWLSANWGLGAAVQLQLASLKDNNRDNRWTSTELAILCSATFN